LDIPLFCTNYKVIIKLVSIQPVLLYYKDMRLHFISHYTANLKLFKHIKK